MTPEQQVYYFANSLQRLREIIGTPWAGNETIGMLVPQVEKIIHGFAILGRAYEELLLGKVQAIRDLQADKERLAKRLEELGVSRDASTVFAEGRQGTANERCGDLDAETRVGQEPESVKLAAELAKLRKLFAAQRLELRACRNLELRLRSRLKDAESMVATKEKERLDLETRLMESENTVAAKEKDRVELDLRVKTMQDLLVKKDEDLEMRPGNADIEVAQKERLDLENRLKESENTVAAKEKERLELELRVKTVQDLLVKKDEELEMRPGYADIEVAKKEKEELEIQLRHANDLAAANELKRLELETRLREAEHQIGRKEEEKQELVRTHSDEMRRLRDDMAKVNSERSKLCREKETLQEKLRKAKAGQSGKLSKKDSGHQDDLSRQHKTLKGYLQTLAANLSSKEKSKLHDLQVELKILEFMGLEEDTVSYLKVILERSLRRPEECVGEKSSDQAGLRRAIEVIDLDDDDSEKRNHESPAPDNNLEGRRRRRRCVLCRHSHFS
ncbi:hypothetical protein R1sor_015091 [Riccia sorocarpa]|uniref:Uncharacterized protein n=1 Tax=Riccia sorocarpa TaxID=122646 RepID=A0ABD3HE79_9MARC